MRAPKLFLILAAFTVITGCCGCSTKKDKAIDSALFVYRDELRYVNKTLPPADYRANYLERAIQFLEGRPSLDSPYMVSMELDYQPNRKEGSRMGVRWCEYETFAVGIVLKTIGSAKSQEWRLPVFEKRYKYPELRQIYHRTVAQKSFIILEPVMDVAPSVRPEVATREDPFPTPVIEFPEALLTADLAVAVYDDKGQVSDFVPVFVWPIEKAEEKTEKEK